MSQCTRIFEELRGYGGWKIAEFWCENDKEQRQFAVAGHGFLSLRLRFMTANSIRKEDGMKRFLALGLPEPMTRKAA